MAINENYRGKKIGKKMLTIMLSKLIELKYSQVSLSVDKRNFAYEFYKKNDFIEINSEKNAVKMLRLL